MLIKPNLTDQQFIACLRQDYGLDVAEFAYLPLGLNTHAAVYRAIAADGTPYFVKLRRGAFDETSVELPKFLNAQGINQIIAPLETLDGRLRTDLDEFKLIVYPFIEGHDAYQTKLTDAQWAEFGTTLQKIHSVALPLSLRQQIAQETYSTEWRDEAAQVLVQVDPQIAKETFAHPIIADAAAFLHSKRADVLALIERATELAQELQARNPKFVLCHTDIHAGNLHITPDGALYVVDWDSPMLAPREHDVMFIGGGQGFLADSGDDEERLFFRGYDQTQIDLCALAYYRFDRTIYDICVYWEQILTGDEQAKIQHLDYLKWNWMPGFTIERAYHADARWRAQAAN